MKLHTLVPFLPWELNLRMLKAELLGYDEDLTGLSGVGTRRKLHVDTTNPSILKMGKTVYLT